MGFLRRLFGFEQTSSLAPGRGWIVPVVGESQYQDTLQSLYRKNGGLGHDIKVSWGQSGKHQLGCFILSKINNRIGCEGLVASAGSEPIFRSCQPWN